MWSLIRFSLVSFVVLALLLGAIRVLLPGSGSTVPRLSVIDPQGCPMPCWLGIRPGLTTMTEAVRLLHESPYIDPDSIRPFGATGPTVTNISFQADWHDPREMLSGVQADITQQSVIIENGAGRDLVKVILVHVNIRLGDFILRFGPPTRSSIGRLPTGDLFYVLEYPALGLQYDTFLSCRRGQAVASLYGSTFVLQPVAEFVSQMGGQLNNGWHGFSPSILNSITGGYQCRP